MTQGIKLRGVSSSLNKVLDCPGVTQWEKIHTAGPDAGTAQLGWAGCRAIASVQSQPGAWDLGLMLGAVSGAGM